MTSLARRAWIVLLGLAAVALTGSLPRDTEVRARNRWHAPLFDGFGHYLSEHDARRARAGARFEWDDADPSAELALRVELAQDDTAPGVNPGAALSAGAPAPGPPTRIPRGLALRANGTPVAWRLVPGPPPALELRTAAGPDGRLRLEFEDDDPAHALLVRAVVVRPARGWFRPTARSLLLALALIALAGLAGTAWRARPAAFDVAAGTAAALLATALVSARVTTLRVLPSLVAALAFGLACDALARRLGAPPRVARWVAAAAFLRLGLVLQPPFPCIDVAFHSGTLAAFQNDELIVSRAPNPDKHAEALPVPYPPALYALLEPLASARVAPRETLVRATLGLLEGSAPLLVMLVARAGGASAGSAALAGAVAALMPEGVLVLGKGIAANVLAGYVGLGALAAALRRRWIATAALLALAFLSHFGQALLLAALTVAWLALARRRRVFTTRDAFALGAATVSAAALAWATYYREVHALALQAAAAVGPAGAAGGGGLGLRPIQFGKIAQNLALKFGAWPLAWAARGLRLAPREAPLATLLGAWLAVGAGAGLLAVVTPVPLRFEYFLAPALALGAGLGLEPRLGTPRERGLQRAFGALLAFDVLLGALLLAERVNLISVILESDRWPFPLRL